MWLDASTNRTFVAVFNESTATAITVTTARPGALATRRRPRKANGENHIYTLTRTGQLDLVMSLPGTTVEIGTSAWDPAAQYAYLTYRDDDTNSGVGLITIDVRGTTVFQ